MLATMTFLGFMALAGILFLRLLKSREEQRSEVDPDYRIERRQRLSRRERKLAQLKEFEDALPPRPTIQELMAEEVRDTGVDQIPGGDGLEVPILLKVWHRDVHVRTGCADGALRFVVRDGIDRATASEADVNLVCDAVSNSPSEDRTDPTPVSEADDGADATDAGAGDPDTGEPASGITD